MERHKTDSTREKGIKGIYNELREIELDFLSGFAVVKSAVEIEKTNLTLPTNMQKKVKQCDENILHKENIIRRFLEKVLGLL